jgi:hypothetical protein
MFVDVELHIEDAIFALVICGEPLFVPNRVQGR